MQVGLAVDLLLWARRRPTPPWLELAVEPNGALTEVAPSSARGPPENQPPTSKGTVVLCDDAEAEGKAVADEDGGIVSVVQSGGGDEGRMYGRPARLGKPRVPPAM